MAIKQKGKRVRFSRSNRSKSEAIEGLKLKVPSMAVQQNLANIANNADEAIAAAPAPAPAPAQKQTILQNYL